ncbi:MAG: hypothetical protein KAH18_02340 [Psychromonas sp.]|nr:hypothetical protein [Psychromonas sp.]
MKKFIHLFNMVLIAFLFSGMCYAAPHTLDTQQGKKSGHIMGNTFSAFASPIIKFIPKVKHVYPVAHGNDGIRYAWVALALLIVVAYFYLTQPLNVKKLH